MEFYNKLRRALKELSDAGRRLELSPCVDNHPSTQACFAVGKSRMVDCMDVVCPDVKMHNACREIRLVQN